jgi:hypothetical protein
MNAGDQPTIRIRARVIGCLRGGFLEILVGAGYGMLDGGIPTEIPLDIVPQALRLPNSEFIVVQDRKQGKIIAVEPIEEKGRLP